MAHWLQRLETAWSRRHVRGADALLLADRGRGPVCIVTGASEGLGRHLANECAGRGWAVMLVARNEAALQMAAAEIRTSFPVAVFIAAIDLTLPAPEKALRTALERHGLYADILVNNAGVGLGDAFAAQDEQRIAALCRLNIDALTSLTRAFLPDMLRRGRGGILNIASIGGLFPGPYQAAYYASKAYVISLSEALAVENAGRGVRISAAAPGPIATRFHEKMGTKSAFYLRLQNAMTPRRAAKLIVSGFMGRKTVIVPGLLPSFSAFAVRLIPHPILVPFIGWLLRKRY